MSMLYVVGTPIGNLQDFSPRAVDTLQRADFIAAEDTRVTVKLLNHFGIKKPMVSYYEHNLQERGDMLVSRMLAGEVCAIVSDAGMPCISDPGEDLVKRCAAAGIPIVVIPGPSAVISALAISGQNTARFTFEGFLSTNRPNRLAHLEALKEETRTMIFYEAPHKLCTTLSDLQDAFGGERSLSLCRELTKIYEEVVRTTVKEAIAHYATNKPKGEFVLVVAGKEETVVSYTEEEAIALARHYLDAGDKATEAARKAAKESGFAKSMLYKNLV